MPFEPSRRAVVAIGLGTMALAPSLASALPASSLAEAWRAACLATERAWMDETAALDRIVERGAEAVHERYFAGAIAHYEDELAWCRSRAHVMRTEPPFGMRVSGFIAGFDKVAESCTINLRGFTAQRALWRRLAAEEGLAALSDRVDAAEAAEDALSASLLHPASGADAALRDQIQARIAPVTPLQDWEVSEPLGSIVAGTPAIVCGSDFSAGVFMRRMEQLGYAFSWDGGAHRLYEKGADEAPALTRRRGRLVACARSLAGIEDTIDSYGRPDRAEWWPGPW